MIVARVVNLLKLYPINWALHIGKLLVLFHSPASDVDEGLAKSMRAVRVIVYSGFAVNGQVNIDIVASQIDLDSHFGRLAEIDELESNQGVKMSFQNLGSAAYFDWRQRVQWVLSRTNLARCHDCNVESYVSTS